MARHFTRARAATECDGWPESPIVTSLTVIDAEPQFTGLLDGGGNAIYRTNDPIGFQF